MRAGSVIGLERAEQLRRYPEVAERPFDPSTVGWRPCTATATDISPRLGAPEAVLALTAKAGLAGRPMGSRTGPHSRIAEDLAGEGLRVLALAAGPCSDPERVISGELAFLVLRHCVTCPGPASPMRWMS